MEEKFLFLVFQIILWVLTVEQEADKALQLAIMVVA
jgi:hypothetical protein